MNYKYGKELRTLRARFGCTVKDFAALFCVGAGTMSKWERDLTFPPAQAINLARVFNGALDLDPHAGPRAISVMKVNGMNAYSGHYVLFDVVYGWRAIREQEKEESV